MWHLVVSHPRSAPAPRSGSRSPSDHHPHAAAHLARRGRDRPPALLPTSRAASSSRPRSRSTSSSRSTPPSTTRCCSSTAASSGHRSRRHQAPAAPRDASCHRRIARVEISSMADMPAGTGLGSSGSFDRRGAAGAARAPARDRLEPSSSPRKRATIEIDRLREPIGKQDQYIAALGGITAFEFHPDDTVEVASVRSPPMTRHQLEDNLLLFFTGVRRSASDVLAVEQRRRRLRTPTELDENLDAVKRARPESFADASRPGTSQRSRAAHPAVAAEVRALPDPGARPGRRLDPRRDRRGRASAASSSAPAAAGSCSSTPTRRPACAPRWRQHGLEEVRFRDRLRGADNHRGPVAVLPVAVLAGGLGTRLRRGHRRRPPKALGGGRGRPFIDCKLDELAAHGLTDVLLLVGHARDTIADHVGDGTPSACGSQYLDDGATLLGTGGADRSRISRPAARVLGDLRRHAARLRPRRRGSGVRDRRSRADDRAGTTATAGARATRSSGRPSRRLRQGSDARRCRAHRLRDAAAPPRSDPGVEATTPFDLGAVLGRLVADGRLGAFEVDRRFHDIGTPAALEETETWLRAEVTATNEGDARRAWR